MPGQQKEERKHPGLKLNAYLKRKTYQYNGRCDAAPHKNTLWGRFWEQKEKVFHAGFSW